LKINHDHVVNIVHPFTSPELPRAK